MSQVNGFLKYQGKLEETYLIYVLPFLMSAFVTLNNYYHSIAIISMPFNIYERLISYLNKAFAFYPFSDALIIKAAFMFIKYKRKHF